MSRSTMVFHKENGEWRVVHVHFSEASATSVQVACNLHRSEACTTGQVTG